MTDKNRDFSQIPFGSIVASDVPMFNKGGPTFIIQGRLLSGYVAKSSDGEVKYWINARDWEKCGGYIVSQPEALAATTINNE